MNDIYELIDGLLVERNGKDARQTAIKIMDSGERLGDAETASEVVGHRFALNPKAVINWYDERKTRLL